MEHQKATHEKNKEQSHSQFQNKIRIKWKAFPFIANAFNIHRSTIVVCVCGVWQFMFNSHYDLVL